MDRHSGGKFTALVGPWFDELALWSNLLMIVRIIIGTVLFSIAVLIVTGIVILIADLYALRRIDFNKNYEDYLDQ